MTMHNQPRERRLQDDFDEVRLRIGRGSIKWDVAGQVDPQSLPADPLLALSDRRLLLPMSLADMEFRPPSAILEALQRCVERADFGYTRLTDRHREAICAWFARQYRWQLAPEWIIPGFGSVPALNLAIQALTEPGDGVIIQTPVFKPFADSITSNGRRVIRNPLQVDASGRHVMDIDDLRIKAADPRARMLILCSPHNPVGRVWSRDELGVLAQICLARGIVVVADEVHADIRRSNSSFHSLAEAAPAIARQLVHLHGPSKTFNLAALKTSTVIVPDDGLRRRMSAAFERINEAFGAGLFGLEAMHSAYTACDDWLRSLTAYLDGNFEFLADSLSALSSPNDGGIVLAPAEGTYLAWLRVDPSLTRGEIASEMLRRRAGLLVDGGAGYGSADEHWIRINLACPRAMLIEAMTRFRRALLPES